MTYVLFQPPIWTNQRTPWELGYLKSYLRSQGHEGVTVDLSLECLPALQSFATEVHRALGDTFEAEAFTTSVNFLTSVSEYLLVRLVYADDEASAANAMRELLRRRTICDEEGVAKLVDVFRETRFFRSVLCDAVSRCLALVGSCAPAVVGGLTHITSMGFAAWILREVKREHPSVRTVLSGYQATISAQASLDLLPWVDYVIAGESELPYARLLSDRAVGRGVLRPERELAVAALPPADYSDIDVRRYRWMSVRAARNCVNRCTFCQEGAFWSRFRHVPVGGILREIQHQNYQHGSAWFDFVDLDVGPFAGEFARELVRSGPAIEWSASMRPEQRTAQYLTTLADSGCRCLTFGLESGSPRVLAMMNRLPHSSPAEVSADLQACSDAGIATGVTAVAGFPGEARDDWQMTLDFLSRHEFALSHVAVQAFKALPQSPIGTALRSGGSHAWPVRVVTPPALTKVQPLLYALNYEGTPSQREAIGREFESRRLLSRLQLGAVRSPGLLFRDSVRKTDAINLR